MLKPELYERGRRVWAASESLVLGHGGLKAVCKPRGWGKIPCGVGGGGCQRLRA